MGALVSELGEHALIERLRARVGAAPSWVILGIGDDAAVVAPERGEVSVLTTDSLVEDVHFRRSWTTARAIGEKALSTSLSDLAAMGAAPRAALLSLALPADWSVAEFDDLIDSFAALGERAGSPLVGGNLTRSPGPLVVNTTAVGSVRRRRILTRGGARPGDELYVTGSLGAAAAGLAMLRADAARDGLDAAEVACIERYERPAARSRCGLIVGRTRAASACVDLSDGLADAVQQLASASRLGAVLLAEQIPVHAGARAWADKAGTDIMELALRGGEDYELLFAVSPRRRSRFAGALGRCPDLPFTKVGKLSADLGLWLERAGSREPLGAGFVHF